MFAQHKWECANQDATKLSAISSVERTNQSVESCLYRLGSKFDPVYERNQPDAGDAAEIQAKKVKEFGGEGGI